MNDKLKKLYEFMLENNLVKSHDLTFDEFSADMKDAAHRKNLWMALEKQDLAGMSEQEFMKKFFGEDAIEKKKPNRLQKILERARQTLLRFKM